MKDYIKHHEWNVIEEGFDPKNNRISESIFSLGNGKMGQRANFEERYSGDSLLGSYIAGVYYPDKTRVGWWKNGYPEYFAKVLNAANWTGIDVEIDEEMLDLAKAKIENFRRVLHMKEGYLERSFTATLQSNKKVEVNTKRFLSIVDTDCGAIEYRVKALNFSGIISLTPYLDLDVKNEDSNYDEKFWLEVQRKVTGGEAFITGETKKTGFQVCSGMTFNIKKNGQKLNAGREVIDREKYVANKVSVV
jgi:maltose phosphorylase